ncbi:MAG: pyruvate dehydrogenase complex dihydrolipoamide acetyltransferase [Flavobacteriales bacterium]|nr:pyruvate dehydrogenase complex dihydrolipoamide acetyltransferase [Flavobacteriales bacterium]MBK7942398.1 pyruvate dehydrogenase complex dihydrolipoamide acetyltransferase [Flavobacteriales bacterium]MBK9699200.1 pyruvate dehydrogenase complex dihydrolipoamide acetyltransferase [Flavobacteriales bacterium]
MAEIVRMPKLSDTMTEGVVAKWHKKVGDKVKNGEILAEIETDKATMEFESFHDGVLLHIGVPEGKTAAVDSLLAVFGKEGEDITKILAESAAPAPAPASPAAASGEGMAPAPAPVASAPKPASAPAPALAANGSGRKHASPLAKRLAEEKGIDIGRVKGSGPDGRVTKRDIEGWTGGGLAYAAPQVESFTEVAVSQMRKTIARRLAESKFSAPHFYLTLEIPMDRAMQVREAINASIAPDKISFNDLVIKAAAVALKQHSKVNSSWLGDRIRFNEHVHIGVAVAVEEGLLVPVVRFADGKPLRTIGAEVRDMAKKAKEKKLQPADWEGNTFTISNLGMFGIEEFTAIINPPDACILAVGGIMEKPVVRNGAIVPGHTMKVTLSCDHRVVDGATGAAFLNTFKGLMEEPALLLGMGAI